VARRRRNRVVAAVALGGGQRRHRPALRLRQRLPPGAARLCSFGRMRSKIRMSYLPASIINLLMEIAGAWLL
jgi:hypothetical protein